MAKFVQPSQIALSPDKRYREAEAENVAKLAAIDARIATIDKELAANFPDYATLVSPAPLSFADVQAQLRSDEALVLFLASGRFVVLESDVPAMPLPILS